MRQSINEACNILNKVDDQLLIHITHFYKWRISMDIDNIIEELGTGVVSASIGLFVGLLFGAFAQQSRFCLRAACIEFWRGKIAGKFSIWLLTFSAALLGTQFFILNDTIDTSQIRQLNAVGSMSGAILGGLLFGVGMILARGCASRQLVLSATGNMRALITGLIITLSAQAALRGILSPVREGLSGIWLIDEYHRGFSYLLPQYSGLVLGILILSLGMWMAINHKVNKWIIFCAIVTGTTITLGWILNGIHSAHSFDLVALESVSFTGPSADTLMSFINSPTIELSFDLGLVPGVFAGSFIASILTKEFKVQQFTVETGLYRYLVGACFMGFGGMLAGGCAVGAGVTGGSLLASTAWVALLCMWLAAGITDKLIDKPIE